LWEAMTYHDLLAATAARLLLWIDPAPLPGPDANGAEQGWAIYLRRWRPGKPHPTVWPACYGGAWDYVLTRDEAAGADRALLT
jgi:hypothetical protein